MSHNTSNTCNTGRPEDCYCHSRDQGLPCYPCHRDGFERPNPDAPDPLQPNA